MKFVQDMLVRLLPILILLVLLIFTMLICKNAKKKIENDAHDKLMKMYNENPSLEKGGRMLVEIMSSGAIEFKEKTGREMTYSEMRDMYG